MAKILRKSVHTLEGSGIEGEMKMGPGRSLDEIAVITQHSSQGSILENAVRVMATFRTKEGEVKRVLPPLLVPDLTSTGFAYVAEFDRTDFGPRAYARI